MKGSKSTRGRQMRAYLDSEYRRLQKGEHFAGRDLLHDLVGLRVGVHFEIAPTIVLIGINVDARDVDVLLTRIESFPPFDLLDLLPLSSCNGEIHGPPHLATSAENHDLLDPIQARYPRIIPGVPRRRPRCRNWQFFLAPVGSRREPTRPRSRPVSLSIGRSSCEPARIARLPWNHRR